MIADRWPTIAAWAAGKTVSTDMLTKELREALAFWGEHVVRVEQQSAAVVLNPDTLAPEAMLQGCRSRVFGPFLGSDAEHLKCALLDGHEGPHYFHVEWDDPSPMSTQPRPGGDHG